MRDGSQLGLSIEYAIQEQPKGLAEAFIIGENFIGNDRVALILGDNIFYGRHFTTTLNEALSKKGATIFGYYVDNPKEYGVVTFDKDYKVQHWKKNLKSLNLIMQFLVCISMIMML